MPFMYMEILELLDVSQKNMLKQSFNIEKGFQIGECCQAWWEFL
jgi:hypothetical protein